VPPYFYFRIVNRLLDTTSAAATKLFDFIDISFALQNSGPCDSFDCFGHSKNVYDDDDDDDAEICYQPLLSSSMTASLSSIIDFSLP